MLLMKTVRMGERVTGFPSTIFPEVADVCPCHQVAGTGNGAPMIPYEHREVIHRHNPNVVLMTNRGVTGYYLAPREQVVIVVFSDRIVRCSYDNIDKFQLAISELETFNVQRINLRYGIVKSILVFGVCILLLELVAFLARIHW